jgi:hypothetical protein
LFLKKDIQNTGAGTKQSFAWYLLKVGFLTDLSFDPENEVTCSCEILIDLQQATWY